MEKMNMLCHNRKNANKSLFIFVISFLAIVVIFSLSSALVQAQEPPAPVTVPYTYAPEGCDFTATFPAEPGFIRRCPSDTSQPCFEVAQYTAREDFDQTINAEISCVLITEDIYESYDEANMKAIVTQLVRDSNLTEPPPISYTEDDSAAMPIKISAASGLKTSGFSEKIFITQVWATPSSIMTIEGEMSLSNDESADKIFADMMRSVRLKEADTTEDSAEN